MVDAAATVLTHAFIILGAGWVLYLVVTNKGHGGPRRK